MSDSQDTADSTIIKLASQCVKCGLCLPHCPTYNMTQDENESPRGRIELMQVLAKHQLPLTGKLQTHLDQCLTCRNCEPVCPAHVQYGELITKSRIAIAMRATGPINKLKIKTKILIFIVSSRLRTRYMGKILRFLELSQLRKISKIIGLTRLLGLQSLDNLLPKVPKQAAFLSYYPALGTKRGEVALFLGCLSQWADRKTPEATIFVLQKLGYAVHIPTHQGCCGAMSLHNGLKTSAHKLATNNIQTFNNLNINKNITAIITTASGCGAELKDYARYFSSDTDLKGFTNTIIDINQFIINSLSEYATLSALSSLSLKPLPITVALHTPCTLSNGMQAADFPKQILSLIPELQWQPIGDNKSCCGSAGTYMLDKASLAERLANNLLSQIKQPVDCIVSSNIGCALHLQNQLKIGAKPGDPDIKIIHPIALFAQSLGFVAN